MKRVLSLLFCVLFLLPCLAACEKHQKLNIVNEGACTVVYDAEQVSAELARAVANDIKQTFGAEVTLKSSASFPIAVYADANTVLLGNLDFEPVRAVTESLRNKDFVVGVFGDYYIVAGANEETTGRAVRHFREEILAVEDGKDTLTVSDKDNYRYDGKYSINDMSIGTVPLYRCEIVLPREESVSEYRLAKQIQKLLVEKTGYTLPIVTDAKAKAEGQIRIGASICSHVSLPVAHAYAFEVHGSVMEIAAGSIWGYEEALSAFQSRIVGSKKEEYALTESLQLTGSGASRVIGTLENDAEVRLFFNNIWNGSDGDTAQRASMQAELFLSYGADVIGLQECSPTMRDAGIDRLLDAGYAEVPTRRGDTYYRDETVPRTPLYYNTATVELLDYGHLALNTLDFSATEYARYLPGGVSSLDMKRLMEQDKYGPDDDGSKGATWAIFRVKETGHVFLVASTHLWWQARDERDDAARKIQMEVMKSYLVQTAADFMAKKGLDGDMPIFVGGDYNSRMSRDSYHFMSRYTSFENLNDRVDSAKRLEDSTMHGGYPTYDAELGIWTGSHNPAGAYENALDHIFAYNGSRDSYEVVRLEMVYDDFAFSSSDHSPIFTDVNFTANAPLF